MSTAAEAEAASDILAEQRVVDGCVERQLEACDYRFVFNKVTWRYEAGNLTLEGYVSSFYLKQILQELLRGTDHVERVHNHVDVVSSTGLSSESSK